MTAVIILALIVIGLLPAMAYQLGVRRGMDRGHENSKAIGWLEHYRQSVARERARRDRYGKFTVKGGSV